MDLEHSFTIPVPPEQAWQVLLDVERMAPCMPGATVNSVDGDVVSGRIKVKVGPVTMTYSGTARFTERDEQGRSVTLEAAGKETRGGGTAAATIHSTLRPEEGQTRVIVQTSLIVTGRPAQFGRGVLGEVSGKVIEKFADNLAALLASPGPGTMALPIEDLNLPVRAFNTLRREGIHTVGDLTTRTEPELLSLTNLGPQSVQEIREKLSGLGLNLTAGSGQAAGASGAVETAAPPAGATGDETAAPPAGAASDATAPAGDETAAAPADAIGHETAAAADTSPPPRPLRPADQEAIDLLNVAGFPVAKRLVPAVGGLVALLLVVLGARRRRKRRQA